jgi:hypothetical protein
VTDEVVWIGRSPEHYWTRGADIWLTASGWFLVPQNSGEPFGKPRARGPLTLPSAMDAWEKMLKIRKAEP